MIKAIIWDYDGTIVDTKEKNLAVTKEIVEEVLKKKHVDFSALVSPENYNAANNRAANWRELYAGEFGMNEEQVDYAGSLWTKYQLRVNTPANLYNGLSAVFNALGHYLHGIVSQNSAENIHENLRQHQLAETFSEIIGYEEVPFAEQKPNPAGLLACINKLAGACDDGIIVYIGDHETDSQCAFNANEIFGLKKVICIGALYEKSHDISCWKTKPDYVAKETTDIPEIINLISIN